MTQFPTARPDQPELDPRPPEPRPAEAPDLLEQPLTAPVTTAPLPPELRDQTASALSRVVRGRPAFPGAPPSAPSFEDEIRAAVSYEKGLAVKALIAIAVVLIVLAVRFYFLG
jgi:hypothetical protein